MKNIVLVGYMGSGKSTIAQKLSELFQKKYLDLDRLIELEENLSIEKIFQYKGEIYFRKKEHQVFLQQLHNPDSIVLSTGGGTPCYYDHHLLLQSEGIISIYLNASVDTLVQRLTTSRTIRPLIVNKSPEELKDFISKHLFERHYYYNHATYSVRVDHKSQEEILEEIRALLA